MTADLVAFLRARLDEDEKAARSAAEPESWMELNREPRPDWYVQWWADPDVAAVVADPESSAYPVATTVQGTAEIDADARTTHIARHDPARVLAEVDAKRRVIDHVDYELADHGADNPWWYSSKLWPVLELLALPYADHPDYREEWRP